MEFPFLQLEATFNKIALRIYRGCYGPLAHIVTKLSCQSSYPVSQ